MKLKLTLGTGSADRKNIPMFSGVLKYAPAALAGVARISKAGNDKHNPGQELHHARGKSNDHGDCIIRHAMDAADIIAHIERNPITPGTAEYDTEVASLLTEASQLAWRALIWSQELHEKYDDAPLAPGARLPVDVVQSNAADAYREQSKAADAYREIANQRPEWAVSGLTHVDARKYKKE